MLFLWLGKSAAAYFAGQCRTAAAHAVAVFAAAVAVVALAGHRQFSAANLL